MSNKPIILKNVKSLNITHAENQVQVETWLWQHKNVTHKYITEFCIYVTFATEGNIRNCHYPNLHTGKGGISKSFHHMRTISTCGHQITANTFGMVT